MVQRIHVRHTIYIIEMFGRYAHIIYVFLQFSEKFGTHYVDFNDPDRPRTPKESSKYLKSLAVANGFIESDGPCSNGPD